MRITKGKALLILGATILLVFYGVGRFVNSKKPKPKTVDDVVEALHKSGISDDRIQRGSQGSMTALAVQLQGNAVIAFASDSSASTIQDGKIVLNEAANLINGGNFSGQQKTVYEDKYSYILIDGYDYSYRSSGEYIYGGVFNVENTYIVCLVDETNKNTAQTFLKELGYPYIK